jgi:hypothetical protein
MANVGNDIIDSILASTLKNTAYTGPAYLGVALYTTITAADGTGTEVANSGSYNRGTIAFGAIGAHSVANSAQVTFDVATGNWGTIGWWGIRDTHAYGVGSLLYYGAFSSSKVINTGNQFIIQTGQATATFS